MMTRLINECVECGDRWNVLEHLDLEQIHLDKLDRANIKKYGQLYSICDDCGYGVCTSVEMD